MSSETEQPDGGAGVPQGGAAAPPVVGESKTTDVPPAEPAPIVGFAMPKWVAVLAAIFGVVFLVAAARVPDALRWAIEEEHADRALAAGNAGKARELLEQLEAKYPNQMSLKIRLIRACLATHDLDKAAGVFERCESREVSQEEHQELDDLSQQFLAEAKRAGYLPPRATEGGR